MIQLEGDGSKIFPYGWTGIWLESGCRPVVGRSLNFPGVYVWVEPITGAVLYVGQSSSVRRRLRQHFRPTGRRRIPALRWRRLVMARAFLYVQRVEERATRLALESRLVSRLRPSHNQLLQPRVDR